MRHILKLLETMSTPNVYSTPSVFIIVPPIPGQQITQGINTKPEIIQGKMLVPTLGNTYLMHKLVTWKITMEFTKCLWSKLNVASISNARTVKCNYLPLMNCC